MIEDEKSHPYQFYPEGAQQHKTPVQQWQTALMDDISMPAIVKILHIIKT